MCSFSINHSQILGFILSLSGIVMFSCKDDSVTQPDEQTRSFYMGFTPWPYDATTEAIEWTYDTILSNGDIISHHMEEGIPWPQAYNNSAFPTEYKSEIDSRTSRNIGNSKVLLSINPLNMNRDNLALYRGSSEAMPLPSPWDTCSLNNAMVKKAFLNYSNKMIEYFNPDYLVLGIEVNLLIRNNPALWDSYIDLHEYIYTELKKIHAELPIGVSVFCVPYFPEWSPEDDLSKQLKGLEDLEPWIDFLSFSIHPFMCDLTANSLPEDYFKRLFEYTNKPIAISESSYPAQSWQTIEAPIINFDGTQEKQANCLSLMLEEANKEAALFVIWFSVRDFDPLWEGALNKDPIALVWRDTGIYDEEGNPRLAVNTWNTWFIKNIEQDNE